MSKLKRYIIGHRFGPQLDSKSSRALEDFVSGKKEAKITKRTSVGRRVVEMTEDQMRELASKNPHLVIEEDQELKMFRMPGLPELISIEGKFAQTVIVKDMTSGKPIPDVTVYGIGEGPGYRSITNKQGQATLETNEPSFGLIIASPRDTYWSRVIYDIKASDEKPIEVNLKPLLAMGAYSWGHRLMGFGQVSRFWTGKDVKIGLLDSGISTQLKDLKPAGGHNTLDGQDPTAWYVDEQGHGTHCAGIIGALNNQIGVLGGAPHSQVYSVKVLPGGYVSDLVEAVEWCIRNRMDIISMSLGAPKPSSVLAGVLFDAYTRGITCIAAAGNSSTHVSFPAAFPTVIAVGAIGQFGTFPEDSAHTLKIGTPTDWQGQLFAANFTNFGQEIEVCAPGVAILSTVPTGYAAWDGTSFSCPLTSALIALILEAYPAIRTGNAQQPEYVRSILHNASVDLGMSPLIQGKGLPLATRALASAQPYGSRSTRSMAQGPWMG